MRRYEVARHAAWSQWGREHHGAIVGVEIAGMLAGPAAALVLLGGAGWGLWWTWHHLPAADVAVFAGVAGVVLLAGLVLRGLFGGPAAGPLVRWSGATVGVVASVVLLFGVSITALVR